LERPLGPEDPTTLPSGSVPLCVDLDGTLIRTDTLHEGLVGLAKQAPGQLFLLPFWLARGRAHLKIAVSRRVPLDPGCLPFETGFVTYLQAQRAAGRQLWLVTGAAREVAEAIAVHLGIFEGVLASEGDENLTSRKKVAALQRRFPEGFDYAGNSWADLPAWAAARQAILVAAPPAVARRARERGNVVLEFPRKDRGAAIVDALRFPQWARNFLVLVPALAAHRVGGLRELAQLATTLVAFGVVDSATFLVRDILDMESDRRRPDARQRPFASGVLSIPVGLLLALALLGAGALIAAWLPLTVGLLLAGSLVATLAYSFSLKRLPIIDVVLLAGLYTARIYAGGVAADVPVSEWLASFSMFLFFSLAFLRRASDLVATGGTCSGRGYLPDDIGPVFTMGISSGYLSVLVLALYISRSEVRRLYGHPGWLWGLCPLVLFWVSHVWLLARRGEVNDDPLSFALRSRESWAVLLLGVALAWLGT